MPGGLTRQTNKPCQVVCQSSRPDPSDQQTMQVVCQVSRPDQSDQQTMQVVCQFSQPDLSDLPVGLTRQTNKPCQPETARAASGCRAGALYAAKKAPTEECSHSIGGAFYSLHGL